jgi:integrase
VSERAPRRRTGLLFHESKDQWRKDYWYAALRAKVIRERDFYCTRHTFIRLALTARENMKAIDEQCGTSAQMIEKHYAQYMKSDFGRA